MAMVGLMILQEKAKATEAYRAKLIEGMNGPLIMDFREGINNLRERALGDRRHYCESQGNNAHGTDAIACLPDCSARQPWDPPIVQTSRHRHRSHTL